MSAVLRRLRVIDPRLDPPECSAAALVRCMQICARVDTNDLRLAWLGLAYLQSTTLHTESGALLGALSDLPDALYSWALIQAERLLGYDADRLCPLSLLTTGAYPLRLL